MEQIRKGQQLRNFVRQSGWIPILSFVEYIFKRIATFVRKVPHSSIFVFFSQFTLYHVLKGNKPDFHSAMGAEHSEKFYNEYLDALKKAYSADKIKGKNLRHISIRAPPLPPRNFEPITIFSFCLKSTR